MKAGRLRSVIEVFAPAVTVDGFGERRATGWESQGRWHAERRSLSSRMSDEAAEHFGDRTVRYNIRVEHHVEPNWQLTGDDGLRYVITAVEPYRWLGMQTLVCERLNP